MESIEEESKIKEIKNIEQVILEFPKSTPISKSNFVNPCNPNKEYLFVKEFTFSINDVMKSQFIQNLIEDCSGKNTKNSNDSDECIQRFEIPHSLYKGVRYIDIMAFYKLWIGHTTFSHIKIHDDFYCLKDILKVTDSLMLSTDLKWVTKLQELFKEDI